jgi:hypothetical protein
MPLRKQYILVSSDERSLNSRSTTDFTVSLREPIQNVVRTDLVNLAIDYCLANIRAPDNVLLFNINSAYRPYVGIDSITIPDDMYSRAELADKLNVLTGDHIIVTLNNSTLTIDLLIPLSNSGVRDSRNTFSVTCNSATLRAFLGLTSTTTSGTYISTLGSYGGMRITCPLPIKLNGLSPFVMIQSTALGVAVKTAKGLGFWRLATNDVETNRLTIQSARVDTYLDEPRRLQDVDIRFGFPDGTPLDNRGGSVSLLVEVVTDESVERRTQ